MKFIRPDRANENQGKPPSRFFVTGATTDEMQLKLTVLAWKAALPGLRIWR